jgi:hypothetical protein
MKTPDLPDGAIVKLDTLQGRLMGTPMRVVSGTPPTPEYYSVMVTIQVPLDHEFDAVGIEPWPDPTPLIQPQESWRGMIARVLGR